MFMDKSFIRVPWQWYPEARAFSPRLHPRDISFDLARSLKNVFNVAIIARPRTMSDPTSTRRIIVLRRTTTTPMPRRRILNYKNTNTAVGNVFQRLIIQPIQTVIIKWKFHFYFKLFKNGNYLTHPLKLFIIDRE